MSWIRPALFLDRDGVINHDYGYVNKIEDFHFINGIFNLVRNANKLGLLVVVVTNQSGIGRGLYSEKDFKTLTDWMQSQFHEQDAVIDGVFFSSYHPVYGIGSYKKESQLRKPNPGMFYLAQQELNIDLPNSIMVGDKLTDVQASIAAGISKNYLLGIETAIPSVTTIKHLDQVIL